MSALLYGYQLDAVERMKRGCILCGDVGTGKSRTSLGYYFKVCGGDPGADFKPMSHPLPLYIITTAKKRNSKEWLDDMIPFGISDDPELNYYKNTVVIDSWNNIKKYANIVNAFFIFDEQRVVGSGAWVRNFYEIAKHNHWILLTATPGDTWEDYIPVFVANGFYRNKTDFARQHIIYSRYTDYPKIEKYVNTGLLMKHRQDILVTMSYHRETVQHHENIYCDYDILLYKFLGRFRVVPDGITRERMQELMAMTLKEGQQALIEQEPIQTGAQLCYLLRKAGNASEDRQTKLHEIFEDHLKVIIFYNFDYELEILLKTFSVYDIPVHQYNGHVHETTPVGDSWVYLVQYTAGCEAWNCITTDTIIFYSQTYSYKQLKQSSGRIDRLNTPYKDLYYYHLKSHSGIDMGISKALNEKKDFNETRYLQGKTI